MNAEQAAELVAMLRRMIATSRARGYPDDYVTLSCDDAERIAQLIEWLQKGEEK